MAVRTGGAGANLPYHSQGLGARETFQHSTSLQGQLASASPRFSQFNVKEFMSLQQRLQRDENSLIEELVQTN